MLRLDLPYSRILTRRGIGVGLGESRNTNLNFEITPALSFPGHNPIDLNENFLKATLRIHIKPMEIFFSALQA